MVGERLAWSLLDRHPDFRRAVFRNPEQASGLRRHRDDAARILRTTVIEPQKKLPPGLKVGHLHDDGKLQDLAGAGHGIRVVSLAIGR